MSVFKRGGTGHYYIQFTYRGKTYVKSSRTMNRRKAEQMERQWRDEIHGIEELGELRRITVHEALEGYVIQKTGTGSERYARQNANVLNKQFPTDLYFDEVRDWHLTRFKSEREREGRSATTIKHNLQALRNAWRWAKDNGYQVKELEYPTLKLPKHRLKYLSIDEEQRLLAALDPKAEFKYRPEYSKRPTRENSRRHDNYDLVVLLLDTGARHGEIANITWDRIDLDNRTINLWRPKVRNESVIYMTQRVYDVLNRRAQTAKAKYVFTNTKGGPRGYAPQGIRRAFKRAGLSHYTIHDLRHTCASRLVQHGMSLYEVSNILGHTDVQTTQRYAHLERRDVSRRARDIMERIHGQDSEAA